MNPGIVIGLVSLFVSDVTDTLGPLATFGSGPRITLYTISSGKSLVHINLETDYGVMIVNDGTDGRPSPRYILACREPLRRVSTPDLDEFRKALALVPAKSTVEMYDSCTVSRSFGLTSPQLSAFSRALRSAKLRLSKAPRITCYCNLTG